MRNRIASWRRRRGLTQVELARAAGISRPYLSQVEQGRKVPGARVVAALCRVLGCTFEDLFCLADLTAAAPPKVDEDPAPADRPRRPPVDPKVEG